jgi:hypothetical protein
VIAEEETPLGPDFKLGQREVDLAILKVIYEDRHSFGYLYWYFLSKYAGEPWIDYELIDQEAPYKKSLIEYAIDFDLEDAVKEYKNFNLDKRYEYVLSLFRQSQQHILVDHQIKDEFESKLTILIEECRAELKQTNLALIEAEANIMHDTLTPEGENNNDLRGSGSFAIYYVKDANNRERLMSYLHNQMRNKRNQYALVYIKAAIEAGLLDPPSFSDFIREFGDICKKSNYYEHINSPATFKRRSVDLERITNELKNQFK